jgi:hypothetical protein
MVLLVTPQDSGVTTILLQTYAHNSFMAYFFAFFTITQTTICNQIALVVSMHHFVTFRNILDQDGAMRQ